MVHKNMRKGLTTPKLEGYSYCFIIVHHKESRCVLFNIFAAVWFHNNLTTMQAYTVLAYNSDKTVMQFILLQLLEIHVGTDFYTLTIF